MTWAGAPKWRGIGLDRMNIIVPRHPGSAGPPWQQKLSCLILQPVLYTFDPHLLGIAGRGSALYIKESADDRRGNPRRTQIACWGFEKMDEAFCAALLNAIEAGQETAPTGVCTAPGTRRPTPCLGPTFNGTQGLSRSGANDGWLRFIE